VASKVLQGILSGTLFCVLSGISYATTYSCPNADPCTSLDSRDACIHAQCVQADNSCVECSWSPSLGDDWVNPPCTPGTTRVRCN
jgi:hypothetical protein